MLNITITSTSLVPTTTFDVNDPNKVASTAFSTFVTTTVTDVTSTHAAAASGIPNGYSSSANTAAIAALGALFGITLLALIGMFFLWSNQKKKTAAAENNSRSFSDVGEMKTLHTQPYYDTNELAVTKAELAASRADVLRLSTVIPASNRDVNDHIKDLGSLNQGILECAVPISRSLGVSRSQVQMVITGVIWSRIISSYDMTLGDTAELLDQLEKTGFPNRGAAMAFKALVSSGLNKTRGTAALQQAVDQEIAAILRLPSVPAGLTRTVKRAISFNNAVNSEGKEYSITWYGAGTPYTNAEMKGSNDTPLPTDQPIFGTEAFGFFADGTFKAKAVVS